MHTNFLGGAALFALLAGTTPAVAQTTSGTPTTTTTDDSATDDAPASDIIVTGSARQQRRFDVSYAVNSLSQTEIQKIAPKSMTDLIGTLPGIHAEATGGEVQNITRVRGIPTDRGFLYYQQDGLPLFQELDGYFFNQGDGMNRLDLMTDRVEVVRGGPAPIYASTAAAIANVITVTGTATTRGKAQLTLGDTGLYRLDAYQAGPVSDDTYYAVGGFLRHHDGYRDSGFPSDRGGQIRANLRHDLANGFVKLSAQYTDDHNLFYLSIPTADPRNPSVSLDPYIDYFTGTLNSPALRDVNIKYRDGAGVLQNQRGDLSNGRHLRFGNVALTYEGDFGDWHVSAKGGVTRGKLHFDAFYSTSNPVDATTFASNYRAAATTAFGANVARLGYSVAGTAGQSAYNPAADSGLVMQAQYRSVENDFHSTQGDVSVTRRFDTAIGTHDLRAGVYGSLWGQTTFNAYQNLLVEVKSRPRTLDLAAYDAGGSVLGYVTDHGALANAATLGGGGADGQLVALYGTDTWDVTDRLRIDAGVRHEWYSYDGFGRLSAAYNLGDPTTLADNATRGFTGAIGTLKLKQQATNWTVGANYDATGNIGAYLRASQLEVPPNTTITLNYPTAAIVATKAKLYEAGVKFAAGRSYLYVTGFYTRFDPLNASFAAFNPATGRADQVTNFIGTAETKGLEADGQLRLAGPFSLAGSVTFQNPRYLNFSSNTGADGSRASGKQIIREPKLFLNVRPTVDFDVSGAAVSVYGRYDYVSRRYTDFFNSTALPAYGAFGLGATASSGDWQVQLVGDNITNAHGFTEGNTAGDRFGQGVPTAIFGRPLFGRNLRLIVSRKW
ncbi:TonB-dependent receptor [Sphingomonas sp. Leaf25]|uniref:TonB-dependent receptor n=1 Tax=Sphingomonas sp. Leaf25 TaxID=1735692 RepID=UPI0007011364|nr:TonB-dependent receptor [Sphingomonas sp. Leaf25]KQN01024.1 TonB-dependent receptor [Sphingomonas sp. Leaf25]